MSDNLPRCLAAGSNTLTCRDGPVVADGQLAPSSIPALGRVRRVLEPDHREAQLALPNEIGQLQDLTTVSILIVRLNFTVKLPIGSETRSRHALRYDNYRWVIAPIGHAHKRVNSG